MEENISGHQEEPSRPSSKSRAFVPRARGRAPELWRDARRPSKTPMPEKSDAEGDADAPLLACLWAFVCHNKYVCFGCEILYYPSFSFAVLQLVVVLAEFEPWIMDDEKVFVQSSILFLLVLFSLLQ